MGFVVEVNPIFHILVVLALIKDVPEGDGYDDSHLDDYDDQKCEQHLLTAGEHVSKYFSTAIEQRHVLLRF